MWHYIVLGWVAFVAVVYALVWFDHVYYRRDLPRKFRRVMESFTEEE